MTRPRAVTQRHCMTCRRTSYRSPEERQLVALHRMEHARADKRRGQWRAYLQRKREKQRGEAPAGYLHNLGCRGKHYGSLGACRAIPVYRGEQP